MLGASQYSVQLSGSTCTVTDPSTTLPRRDVPVVRARYELRRGRRRRLAGRPPPRVAEAVRSRLASHGSEEHPDEDVAVALHWTGLPLHARVRAFAEGVADGLAARTARGLPVLLVLDADIARTLGRILRDELGVQVPLVVLDGLRLDDFDYVDLGRVRQPSGTVPVTIKSLVFSGVDVRQVRPAAPVGEPGVQRRQDLLDGADPAQPREHVVGEEVALRLPPREAVADDDDLQVAVARVVDGRGDPDVGGAADHEQGVEAAAAQLDVEVRAVERGEPVLGHVDVLRARPQLGEHPVPGGAGAVRRARRAGVVRAPRPVPGVDVGEGAGEVAAVGGVVGAGPDDGDAARRGSRRRAVARDRARRPPRRRAGSARAGRTRAPRSAPGRATSGSSGRQAWTVVALP